MNKVVELNNMGVSCLRCGDFKQASVLLRKALKDAIEELQNEPDNSDDSQQNHHDQVHTLPSCLPGNKDNCDCDIKAQEIECLCLIQISEGSSVTAASDPFLYPRGIETSHLLVESGSMPSDVNFSIILFNFGLVYHLRGIQ